MNRHVITLMKLQAAKTNNDELNINLPKLNGLSHSDSPSIRVSRKLGSFLRAVALAAAVPGGAAR